MIWAYLTSMEFRIFLVLLALLIILTSLDHVGDWEIPDWVLTALARVTFIVFLVPFLKLIVDWVLASKPYVF